jgi:two-component system, chemotaxis family, CheB/CheR fusion protein
MISATPHFAEDGKVRGAAAAIVDISLHKHAEAQQQFLLSELQHRVKNILATISSLATRISQRRLSVEDFRSAFLSRLGAMSRTHDLLTSGAWSGASLRSLVEVALEPYVAGGKGNSVLDGPDIRMTSNAATTLGMIFHELATNASKYGALSRASGRVQVSWSKLSSEPDGERLEVTWIERGGPPVDPSRPPGFGTGFITRSVEYELLGRMNLELTPEGLRCTIRFPIVGNVEEPPPQRG